MVVVPPVRISGWQQSCPGAIKAAWTGRGLSKTTGSRRASLLMRASAQVARLNQWVSTGAMRMSRLVSNRKVSRSGPLLGISDVCAGKYSRLPAARVVRFGTQVLDLPSGAQAADVWGDAARQDTGAKVASATLDASYRGQDFHVTAWQPEGKPAFVFVVALKDRRWIQPDVAEAADFDEVLSNAVAFVERVLDGEAEQGG